jgi:hypothetical protein
LVNSVESYEAGWDVVESALAALCDGSLMCRLMMEVSQMDSRPVDFWDQMLWDQMLWDLSSVLATHLIAVRTAAACRLVTEAAAVALQALVGWMMLRLVFCCLVVAMGAGTQGKLGLLRVAAAVDRPAVGMSCGVCVHRRESPSSGHR